MINEKRVLLAVLQLVALVSTVAAWSMAHERIWIRNDLDNPIGVYCEFQYEGDIVPHEYWGQTVAGVDVLCDTLREDGVRKLFKPDARIRLVEYRPDSDTGYLENLAHLKEIPLEQKLKELFKTLVITDAEGRVLPTLEDFSKARVERKYQMYTIIIGDYLYQ